MAAVPPRRRAPGRPFRPSHSVTFRLAPAKWNRDGIAHYDQKAPDEAGSDEDSDEQPPPSSEEDDDGNGADFPGAWMRLEGDGDGEGDGEGGGDGGGDDGGSPLAPRVPAVPAVVAAPVVVAPVVGGPAAIAAAVAPLGGGVGIMGVGGGVRLRGVPDIKIREPDMLDEKHTTEADDLFDPGAGPPAEELEIIDLRKNYSFVKITPDQFNAFKLENKIDYIDAHWDRVKTGPNKGALSTTRLYVRRGESLNRIKQYLKNLRLRARPPARRVFRIPASPATAPLIPVPAGFRASPVRASPVRASPVAAVARGSPILRSPRSGNPVALPFDLKTYTFDQRIELLPPEEVPFEYEWIQNKPSFEKVNVTAAQLQRFMQENKIDVVPGFHPLAPFGGPNTGLREKNVMLIRKGPILDQLQLYLRPPASPIVALPVFDQPSFAIRESPLLRKSLMGDRPPFASPNLRRLPSIDTVMFRRGRRRGGAIVPAAGPPPRVRRPHAVFHPGYTPLKKRLRKKANPPAKVAPKKKKKKP